MRTIWVIAKRELGSFFDSLIAYILLILFLGFSGFFTWLFGSDIFFIGQASLQSFFNIAFWTLFFFIPALTMRLLAEEKKTGTIELLLDPYIIVPKNSDVRMRATSSANNTEVEAGMNGYLAIVQ